MAHKPPQKREWKRSTATSFLQPSGVEHHGPTYESYFADKQPDQSDFKLAAFNVEDAATRMLERGLHPDPKRPASYTKPAHVHDWLVRHDYQQCRSCGTFLKIKKGVVVP